jgi:hypothetical protein
MKTQRGNQRGAALLYLVFFFILLGVLVSVGARKFGAQVSQGKNNDTKKELERNVLMITAWGVKNGRLPSFSDYSASLGAKPKDAWGRPLMFAYYSSLTKISRGGICGLTATSTAYNGQDVAFVLVSAGDDASFTSIPATSGAFSGASIDLKVDDLFRVVTLKELQEQASCFGTTQGKLRIVNNELPGACKRRSYSATIIGDGGAPRYGSYTSYSYSFAGLPVGLTGSSSRIFGVSTTAKGYYNVGVTMTDNAANFVKRSYILNLMSSCY